MTSSAARDFRAYLPGFALVVVLAGALAFAPSVVPEPIRDLFGFGSHRLEPEVPVTTSGQYRFEATQSRGSDEPVGYDPCKAIKVRINPKNAPEGYLLMVRDAMTEIGRATGLRLEYDGTTTARPSWDSETSPTIFGRPKRIPALVAWATPAEVPELAGRVAGLGGSVAYALEGERVRYVTGSVTLDAALFRQLVRTPAGRVAARAIVLHEFGHLVGLGHVRDPSELMYASTAGQTGFGPGDLEGLARVGATDCA